MCGRFALFIDSKTLIEAFGLDPAASQLDLPLRYNIAPAQQVLGWLFAILARILEDKNQVKYRKVDGRAYYRSK